MSSNRDYALLLADKFDRKNTLTAAEVVAIELAKEVRELREENERLKADAERLDWIAEEYAHLQPFGIPTGEGDFETGWRVLQEHCCRPSPQIIAEVYSDSVRDAIDAARSAK